MVDQLKAVAPIPETQIRSAAAMFVDTLGHIDNAPTDNFCTGAVSNAIRRTYENVQDQPKLLTAIAREISNYYRTSNDQEASILAKNLAPFLSLLGENLGNLTKFIPQQDPKQIRTKMALLNAANRNIGEVVLEGETKPEQALLGQVSDTKKRINRIVKATSKNLPSGHKGR